MKSDLTIAVHPGASDPQGFADALSHRLENSEADVFKWDEAMRSALLMKKPQ